MYSDKLAAFIDSQDSKLERYYSFRDKQEKIFSYAIKLTEEVGELQAAVLATRSLQRKEKLERFDNGKAAAEVADVLITTLLLARSLDIDVAQALEQKIKKIKQRFTEV